MDKEKLNKEVINPISIEVIQGYAKCERSDGKIEKIPVYDQNLTGMYIPTTIENPEGFLRNLERQRYIQSMSHALVTSRGSSEHMEDVPIVPKAATGFGIVRPAKPEEPKVSDFANFCVIPKIRYIYINRIGEQKREWEEILAEIVFTGAQKEILYIKTKDIQNLCKIIKKRFAIACIDFETKNVEKWIERDFREAVRQCRTVCRYYEQGWQMIGGEMVYANKSAKCFKDVEYTMTANLPLVSCSPEYIGKSLLIAFDLYQNRASMATMIMSSLLGVMYRPFKEAGYPPKFLLFLYGKTGSMKTTIAKILFSQLGDDKVRDNPRRIDSDTIVSFERAVIESGYDTVTLIDDYSPAKSRKKKEEMANKLESIIRLVGDASSKSRSNIKLEDCRGEGVQGTVVLTGELRGKGLSSNLRCLYCKMTREMVNTETVSWFQGSPYIYTTIIHEFAKYVGENWVSIVTYIRNSFPGMRKRLNAVLSERRLVDAVVTLVMVYDVMYNFLVDYCKVKEEEVMKAVGNVEQDIINNAQMSQAISSEDSPSVLFIKTINDLMRVGTIVLGTGKIAMHDIDKFDGFDDMEYFYFNPEMVFKKVRSFLMASNIDLAMDLKEMLIALYDDGILKTAPNGKGKRTYCVRLGVGDGKKQNFLKISKVIFRKVLEDSMDTVW